VVCRPLSNDAEVSIFYVSDGEAVLATASSTGHVALWDLNNQGRLFHMARGVHDAAVTSVEWIPGQPVLVSSGDDNSVKVKLLLFLSVIPVFLIM
jgi:U3 small nucleolar RNA-associated protein 21